ncbi:MAG: DUF4444 domain-containing protein [Roseobacter sp.]
MTTLSLPPLFQGMSSNGNDPFEMAIKLAQEGCDAGVLSYDLRADTLRAAMVFAPEVLLQEAVVMLPICAVGFQNALGALAPPEVGVHLEWDGTLRVNGGKIGGLRLAAPAPKEAEIPNWLIVGLEIALWPAEEESGLTPDVTALFNEGCADVDAPALLEAWVRHSLVWINQWLDDGARKLHAEWTGLAHGLKETVHHETHSGIFIGVDENFGMILQSETGTKIIPLTDILTEPS